MPYFADCMIPQTNGDAAKGLVWDFIAGFIEGLVPNFIDRLVREQPVEKELQEGNPED